MRNYKPGFHTTRYLPGWGGGGGRGNPEFSHTFMRKLHKAILRNIIFPVAREIEARFAV